MNPNPWWNDLGDGERTHSVAVGGFPEDLRGYKFELVRNPELHYPVMIYRHASGDVYVYGRGTFIGKKSYFARVDAETLKVKQRFVLPHSAYIGGAVLHPNGSIYLVHGRRLYRFEGGDLDRITHTDLPKVGVSLTAINGMAIAPDGRLVTKGWGMDRRDHSALKPSVKFILSRVAVLVAAWAVVAALVPAAALPYWVAVLLLGLTPLFVFLGRTLPSAGKGWVAVIDPDTLALLHCEEPPERIAYGRLTVAQHDGKAYVVAVGGTRLFRWLYEDGRLTLDPRWDFTYRAFGDGSSIACAATAAGGAVYLTDNALPAESDRPGLRLFCVPLGGEPVVKDEMSLKGPGLNLWCSATSVDHEVAVVYDIFDGRMEGRRMGDLALLWGADVCCTDAAGISRGSGHVYATDWKSRLPMSQWGAVIGPVELGADVEKDLVVLGVTTGEELARIPLGPTSPTMSAVVPGAHDEVLVSTRGGLVRVVARRSR